MDWLSTIIGAALGFASSIGIIIVQHAIDKAGKLEIYAKVVYDRSSGHTWGFQKNASGVVLNVPIWVEIQNLSNSSRILRDINLLLAHEGKELVPMVQINRTGNKDHGEILLANEGSYSLSAAGREIRQIICHFSLKEDKAGSAFDEILLRYYDEKNCTHKFSLGIVNGDWKEKDFPRNEEWIKLKEKRQGRNGGIFQSIKSPALKMRSR